MSYIRTILWSSRQKREIEIVIAKRPARLYNRDLDATLHSPTFTIDKRYVHVLAAGRASRIN